MCLIAKDEETNLSGCLASARDLVEEIVVVDTGSTDRTKEVAACFGARVFDFAWVDDFAAARNENLRYATGQWVLWLDGDERFDEENRQRLRTLLAGLGDENAAYVMTQRSGFKGGDGTATDVTQVRLFRNHPEIRWQYRVHEQILPAVLRMGGDIRWTDIIIQHAGYQDEAVRQGKARRNLRLVELEYREQPDDPFTLFNLSSTYLDLNRPAEALPLLRRSLEQSEPAASIVPKLYALTAQCHRRLKNPREALAACRAGLACRPGIPELLFLEGELLYEQGDLAGAEAFFLQLITDTPQARRLACGLETHHSPLTTHYSPLTTNRFFSEDAGLCG